MRFRHIVCSGYHYTLTNANWIDFLSLVQGDCSPVNALASLRIYPDAPSTDVTQMTQHEAGQAYKQFEDSLK
jgi:hypothetical protein